MNEVQACCDVSKSKVHISLESLAGMVSKIEDIPGEMEVSFQSVLVPESTQPTCGSEKCHPVPSRSDLASRLDELYIRLCDAHARIQVVMSRSDV